ncbi:hypothetical protein CJ305_01245 [Leeuwenhoekiella nanhaiensis]|uniref:Uncharacterized protein n=1 Tax=Leeuwenhoekiella nanhaiensis TaxID=1655491 RepID=A0A2G1VVT2_9FLAO|nr:hypothetical protein CJ305_01245 [Leeuwenhoekiella nanhaiensis]
MEIGNRNVEFRVQSAEFWRMHSMAVAMIEWILRSCAAKFVSKAEQKVENMKYKIRNADFRVQSEELVFKRKLEKHPSKSPYKGRLLLFVAGRFSPFL